VRYRPADIDHNWGYLPDWDEKRCMFKISDGVEKLGADMMWSFSEELEAEYGLVAAVYVGGNEEGEGRRIVRQKLPRAQGA
jgi:hypothetical protein